MTMSCCRPERAVYTLRTLYLSFGYRRYKVSKFEEYDLYAENKSFLSDKSILTFTDTDGRLMALKPDITPVHYKKHQGQQRYAESIL